MVASQLEMARQHLAHVSTAAGQNNAEGARGHGYPSPKTALRSSAAERCRGLINGKPANLRTIIIMLSVFEKSTSVRAGVGEQGTGNRE
jgi:hypothetical protein